MDLPPLLIQSGDSEVLQDEITLLANRAELAGVKVRHEEYQDGVRVFSLFSAFTGFLKEEFPPGSCLPDLPLPQDMARRVHVDA